MSSRPSGEGKKEDVFTVALVMAGLLLALVVLIWLGGSTKIVTFWTQKLYTVGRLWLLLPGDLGVARTNELFVTATAFVAAPMRVGLMEWAGFINKALAPLAILLALAQGAWLAVIMTKRSANVRRVFKPQHLAEQLSLVFTGIAPVLHLRKAIAKDKEPYWRRQLAPHELLLSGKVDGKPLVADGKVVEERVRDYFMGIEKVRTSDGLLPTMVGGRLISRTIGRQVVLLPGDIGRKGLCFPDRFSSTGKVIYALLCAHAFGGDEGKQDYAKARDQLNNSARGAPHGFANLTVAQWLYDKYRMNPSAAKLFAVHHWEYSYLYALAVAAKRQGKCGHWEFMWCKPMNRWLFYVMNNVGRMTPHTEAAAAFCQYVFERRAALRQRLPLQRDASGIFQPVIFVEKAVKGLSVEWDRWKEGVEEDDEWWLASDPWERLSGISFQPPPAPPPSLAGETEFDRQMSRQAAAGATTQPPSSDSILH